MMALSGACGLRALSPAPVCFVKCRAMCRSARLRDRQNGFTELRSEKYPTFNITHLDTQTFCEEFLIMSSLKQMIDHFLLSLIPMA